MIRPLPRSLDPLPDESLAGFLLRLSHRLELAPQRLANLTGLGSAVTARHQLRLSPEGAVAFAHATRLSTEEVTQLGLDTFSDRYPPLALIYDDSSFVRRERTLPGVAGWLNAASSRYCPDCLAGDSSDIQNAHGGPWRKLWRLPIIFACTVHQRLLRHRCPRCQQQAMLRVGSSLISAATTAGQHPAACRTELHRPDISHRQGCGYRLDQADGPEPEPASAMQHLLHHQHLILERLHLDHVGPRPGRPREQFYDLQLTTSLIRGTWPTAAEFAPAFVNFSAVDAHIEHLRHDVLLRRGDGKRTTDLARNSGPPDDPRSCAHLLALADHLRPDTATAALDAVLAAAIAVPGWVRHLSTTATHCSPPLAQLIAEHLPVPKPPRPVLPPPFPRLKRRAPIALPPQPPRPRAERRARKAQAEPVAPSPIQRGLVRFDRRHIPQRLPDQVVAPVFDLLPSGMMMSGPVHRYATVALLRLAGGGTFAEACRYLDLPPRSIQQSRQKITVWAKAHGLLGELATRMDTLLHEFNRTTSLIDYQCRRLALHDWSIPDDDWDVLEEELRQQSQSNLARFRTDWGPRKQRFASLVLWTKVTNGDYLSAPLYKARSRIRPIDDRFTALVHYGMYWLVSALKYFPSSEGFSLT